MTKLIPYKRRLQRAFGSSYSSTEIDLLINKYKENLDEYLVIIYAKRYLGMSFDREKVLDYNQAFSLLKDQNNINYDISISLAKSDFYSLNRQLIEVVDYFKFGEKDMQSLTDELKWVTFDRLAKENLELLRKKDSLYQKYKGSESDLFEVIKVQNFKNHKPSSNSKRNSLLMLLTKFRPEKIYMLDSLLSEWKGKEGDLLSQLKGKFESESNEKTEKINQKLKQQNEAKLKVEEEKQEKEAQILKAKQEEKQNAERALEVVRVKNENELLQQRQEKEAQILKAKQEEKQNTERALEVERVKNENELLQRQEKEAQILKEKQEEKQNTERTLEAKE
jgi:hypothetical protein